MPQRKRRSGELNVRKDKLSKQNVILYFLGIIPVVWLGLLIAPCLEDGLIGLVQQFGTIILINFHLEGMVGEVVDLRDGDIENARELVDLAFLVICEQLIVSSQAQVDFLHVLQSLSPPS